MENAVSHPVFSVGCVEFFVSRPVFPVCRHVISLRVIRAFMKISWLTQ